MEQTNYYVDIDRISVASKFEDAIVEIGYIYDTTIYSDRIQFNVLCENDKDRCMIHAVTATLEVIYGKLYQKL